MMPPTMTVSDDDGPVLELSARAEAPTEQHGHHAGGWGTQGGVVGRGGELLLHRRRTRHHYSHG